MLGLIEVRLLNHTRNAWRAFIRCSVKWTPFWTPKTTGDADYLLRVTVPDLPGLSHLISHILAQNKGWPSENRRRAQPPERERPADAGHDPLR